MECYLDNAATTRALPDVCGLVAKVMAEDYGNPSSLHKKGFEGEQYVREAAGRIAKTLKCDSKNIIFTSGGTESNNMALLGTALANRRSGKHIVTTCFEHASVHAPLKYLEQEGFEVEYLPVDSTGRLLPETLRGALRNDTVLVSLMAVNNEIGSVLDVGELGRVVREAGGRIVFHVDAVQAYGKIPIYPKKSGIDLMSVSGHKIHGPKGTGFLYRDSRVKMNPILYGGGQQGGMRPGTENVPGIAGLGLAAEQMYRTFDSRTSHLYHLKKYFLDRIGEIGGVCVNACSPPDVGETAPHIVSASFRGVRSEVLLHALEEKGIYVSSGSACSSNHPRTSSTLQAIGVDSALLDSTIRFSFCGDTTEEQIGYTISCLSELVPVLSRYAAGGRK